MPRIATTEDAFNAIAEPRRRHLLDVLSRGERPVNDLVKELGWAQPQVSKHLHVLRQVDLVSVRSAGRRRVYRLNAARLKPVHDWVSQFERYWAHQLQRVKELAERKARQRVEENKNRKPREK